MELAAYIYDAWAYEQANQESDQIHNDTYQINDLGWDLTKIKWQSYWLPAIAVASLSGFGYDLERSVEASQLLESAVNVAPWCGNLYLCNTSYVLEVQTLLANRGLDVGELDGVYGRYTKQAVINFQRSKNLAVDGIPGEKTLSLLRDSSVTVLKSGQVIGSDRPRELIIVRTNDSQSVNIRDINIQLEQGSEIGNLQMLLKQRGFYQGEIDGRQGQTTTNAIGKAQQAYGLSPDGFAGPLTMRALLAGGSNVAFSQPAVNQLPNKEAILQAQLLLKERGFYDEELNGLYTIQTKASISKAQVAYGQRATGDLSLDLITSLRGQNQVVTQNIQNAPSNLNIRSGSNSLQPNNAQPNNSSQALTSSQNTPLPTDPNSSTSPNKV